MASKIVRSWSFAFIMLAAVAVWWGLKALPPASFWFRASTMIIPDVPAGDDVILLVDRQIHRPVYGEWTTTLRQQTSPQEWQLVCVARGDSDYDVRAALPSSTTLDWWTGGQCENPGPGTYFLTTTWTFFPDALPGIPLPNGRRTPPLVSNAFRVLDVEGLPAQ